MSADFLSTKNHLQTSDNIQFYNAENLLFCHDF